MKRTFIILMLVLTQTPIFAHDIYRFKHHKHPPVTKNYHVPNNTYYSTYPYSYTTRINPVTRFKQYFYGVPTGYTINNGGNQIKLFGYPSNNGYSFNNNGYFTRNNEVGGSGMVTIIND